MPSNIVPPCLEKQHFTCPNCMICCYQHCGVGFADHYTIDSVHITKCSECDGFLIRVGDSIVFPSKVTVVSPHEDMPDLVRSTYLEAAAVFDPSPRASAALLRLALEQLMDTLSAEGNSISAKIGWLVVHRRLDPEVQQMLDTIRVVGNHSVHPGIIDLSGEDTRDTGILLFEAINFIIDELISKPARRSRLWGPVPESERKHAVQRDIKNRNLQT